VCRWQGSLRELQGVTGTGRLLFPSIHTGAQPISKNTLNGALRRLGYRPEDMTAHGFRSMAATRLNELGWNSDVIERQLAHQEPNAVRRAYTHATEYWSERVKMMQAWADYLDNLRSKKLHLAAVS
jgi:integrase